jgi:ATP-binding cassette subfamily F protein 3
VTVLTATRLAVSFGDFDLFSGITLSVPPDGRIGLVGPNGVGKTTLLLILAGLGLPSSGSVARARGARVGYLPQEAADAFVGDSNTVYGEMLAVFTDLRADELRLGEIEAEISAGSADPELIERYSRLQEQFERQGGYDYTVRIRRTLTGLGFGPDRWDMPLAQLSGGQKTRALLARLLLDRPDLLILDEPTNHLDIEAVEWLEGMLAAWEGALVVVSHDRYFLDRAVNTVWEMAPAGIETYRGNYSAYVQQRAERWTRRMKEYEAMKARFEKELDFIRRNIAGQQTRMAQGKLSRLGREVEAVHAGGLDALNTIQSKGWLQATASLDMERPSDRVNDVGRRIGELRPPAGAPPALNLRLRTDARGGDIVLRTTGLTVGYPGNALFTADDILLMRGRRAALIGGNGSGKTTFLRTIREELAPLAGSIKMGGGQQIGYFAQAQDGLNPDDTVLEALLAHGRHLPGEARSYLAQFLFREDDVYKRVSSLSGGERGRLALAVLALDGANLLLLDEPTNHLDIPSQEILEAVLASFEGTLLLVSHDRYLVDRLATEVWALEGGRLRVYPDGYQGYLEARRTADGRGRNADTAASGPATVDAPADGRPKLSKNEQQRRAAAAARLEARIAELESEIVDLTLALQAASEAGAFTEIQRLSDTIAATQAQVDASYAEWDGVMAEIG